MTIPLSIQRFFGFKPAVPPPTEYKPEPKLLPVFPPVTPPIPSRGADGEEMAPKLVGKQDLERFEKGLKGEFSLLMENLKLMKQVQEAQYQSEAQRKFLAMVAHDAQNPLAAILGYAEFLGSKLEGLPTEARCATNIAAAANMLQQLITDLMDMAALECGKFRINPKPIQMTEVVKDVLSRVQVTAGQRSVRLSLEMPETLPPMMGDPMRLEQVVQNLTSNAVQYTEKDGTVYVKVEQAPAGWLTVSVRDTGIGISAEDLPHVFERYFRSRASQQMRPSGFGLGLEISREIVQMHGGEIGVESEVGKGSKFYFKIPIQNPE